MGQNILTPYYHYQSTNLSCQPKCTLPINAFLFAYFFICLYVCLSVCLAVFFLFTSTYLFVCLCLSTCPSMSFPICLSAYLTVCLSACLSAYQFMSQPVYLLSNYLCIYYLFLSRLRHIHIRTCLSVYLFVPLYLYLSASLPLSVCHTYMGQPGTCRPKVSAAWRVTSMSVNTHWGLERTRSRTFQYHTY